QCPSPTDFSEVRTAWKPKHLKALVNHVSRQLRVDSSRFYVSGLSMGGFGTWRYVASYPDEVAAAVPICGGGNTAWAKLLTDVPIWCFHGAKDNVVPLKHSQEMIDAIRAAGGQPKLTIYPEAGHDSWSKTYTNEEVYEWMLSHHR
ncbi:MAG: prolyl oligopeptidase family serine peptidase, partial [Gammaproteobacteria bacterium]|nr:prolyl oligopeptidase family serine peptidase [Gammaproteobacteria bacterium]